MQRPNGVFIRLESEPAMFAARYRIVTRTVALVFALVMAYAAVLGPGRAAPAAAQSGIQRRVYVPCFDRSLSLTEPSDPWPETAVFWFGQVNRSENYADVRVGATPQALYVRFSIVDRVLWYDTTPTASKLSQWDAATVYVDLSGNSASTPGASAYRFVAQLNTWEDRANYQTAYRGNGSGWQPAALDFNTMAIYRGSKGLNNGGEAEGWILTFEIPFSSLGLSGRPVLGTTWRFAVAVHDRDSLDSGPLPDKRWVEGMDPARLDTWGQLVFGLPSYDPGPGVPEETVTLRHNLNGTAIADAAVGGSTICGGSVDYWSQWGETTESFYGDPTIMNVQTQADVADWPCFSKYYVAFPLDSLPSNRTILSATLTLYQFGNAGGGPWGDPSPSYIQVFRLDEGFSAQSLTWNNAPLAVENVTGSWVDPLATQPSTAPRQWDVSRAAAQAYAAGQPLRLALYSADSAYHSGKYFYASDTAEWNAERRPTLTVILGRAATSVSKEVAPFVADQGDIVHYALTVVGSGNALTLTDPLPSSLDLSGTVHCTVESCGYDAGTREVWWAGNPTAGQIVTISFDAVIQVSGPLTVINTAQLTDAALGAEEDTAVLIVGGHHTYLPLVLNR